jgi:hypothetical protein
MRFTEAEDAQREDVEHDRQGSSEHAGDGEPPSQEDQRQAMTFRMP